MKVIIYEPKCSIYPTNFLLDGTFSMDNNQKYHVLHIPHSKLSKAGNLGESNQLSTGIGQFKFGYLNV